VIEADDRAACEVCARRAEHWMRERLSGIAGYQPVTAIGEVIAEAIGAMPVAKDASHSDHLTRRAAMR
jgi:hypothetical protein